MEDSIAITKLSQIKKVVRKLEQTQKNSRQVDMDVPMELLVGSLFPNLLNNFREKITQSYIEGFNAGKASVLEDDCK